eukprot:1380024-Pyramimonas_sp.AAC.1
MCSWWAGIASVRCLTTRINLWWSVRSVPNGTQPPPPDPLDISISARFGRSESVWQDPGGPGA